MSARDELQEEMCRLAHDLADVRVVLVMATERFRCMSEVATKCELAEMEKRILQAIQFKRDAEIGQLSGEIGKASGSLEKAVDAAKA